MGFVSFTFVVAVFPQEIQANSLVWIPDIDEMSCFVSLVGIG